MTGTLTPYPVDEKREKHGIRDFLQESSKKSGSLYTHLTALLAEVEGPGDLSGLVEINLNATLTLRLIFASPVGCSP
jgi:hypothetical protein